MFTRRKIMAAALSASMLLAACSAQTAEKPAIGMPNPASAYCIERGGKLEIRKEAAGDTGYCHLPDGRVVEEWALFRAEKSPPSGSPASTPRG